MASAGAVPIQGCAIRVSKLTAAGNVVVGATGMIVDDKPMVKFTATPSLEAGVEIIPKSACGAPIISYKDYDRIKRWDIALDLGDWDFDKKEMLGGGDLVTVASSSGRTFADGVTVLNSTTITSAAAAAFTINDVGRTVTGTGVPALAYIVEFVDALTVIISAPATASGTGLSLVLGAIAARTVAYRWPKLLEVTNPNGVAIEIWQKAVVRDTGFQGTTPYPSVGSAVAPILPSSAWYRFGAFRCILTPGAVGIENKEGMQTYSGWAIENPNFGTGPVHDWTQNGQAGGVPIDTTRWANAMMDYQLPSPLQPGYQTTS